MRRSVSRVDHNWSERVHDHIKPRNLVELDPNAAIRNP
jgi:hypothetical protein